MKKLLLLSLIFNFVIIVVNAQNFEGKMTFKNTYTSKLPQVTNEQWNTMMGSIQEYWIKDSAYKSVTNGTIMQWQLYNPVENRLYNKMSNSESVLWMDGDKNDDEVISAVINKGVVEIQGYLCDELILTCKKSVQKYYFNSAFKVDASLFIKHKFGNWYDIVSRTNSLPLKSYIQNAQFIMEGIVTEITPMKLEASLFELPEGIPIAKMPE
ncbi:MAG: hypothetical protein M3Q95_06655 [Bacteroidota bacterium]|nr:hypothetical protein [Bacteroidota bacterium]